MNTRQQVERLTVVLEREHARAEHLARQLRGTTRYRAGDKSRPVTEAAHLASILLRSMPPEPSDITAARRAALIEGTTA